MKSIRQARTLEFKKKYTNIFVLDLNDYIVQTLNKRGTSKIHGVSLDSSTLPTGASTMELTPEEIIVLNEMVRDGHKGLYEYIIHSMWEKDWTPSKPPQKRPTCIQKRQQNGCWFDLGKLETPPLLLSREYWEFRRPVCLLNSGTTPDCQMYLVETKKDVSSSILCAFLNSSLGLLFRELHGRTSGGGMNRLQVYEAENLPVLDPRKLSKAEITRIEKVMKDIITRGETSTLELDEAILASLGLGNKAKEVSVYAEYLYNVRKGSKEAGTMIEGIEGRKSKIKKLKGAEILTTEQSKLEDF